MVAILILFAEILLCVVMILPTAMKHLKPNSYLRLSFDGGSRGVNALGSGGAILHLCLAGISSDDEQSAGICAKINCERIESFSQSVRTKTKKEEELSDGYTKREFSRFSAEHRTTQTVTNSEGSSSISSDIDSYRELELWRGTFFFGDGISSHLAEYMSLIEGLHAYRNLVHSKGKILLVNRSQTGGGERGGEGGWEGEEREVGGGGLRNEKGHNGKLFDDLMPSNEYNKNGIVNSNQNTDRSIINGRKVNNNFKSNILYIQGDSEIVINNLLKDYPPKNQLLRSAHVTASTLLNSISNHCGTERELLDEDGEKKHAMCITNENRCENENEICNGHDNEKVNKRKNENPIEFNSDKDKNIQSRKDLEPSDSMMSTPSISEKDSSDFDCFDVRTDRYVLHHVYRENNVQADELSTCGVERRKSLSVYNEDILREKSAVKNYTNLQGQCNSMDSIIDKGRIDTYESENENNDNNYSVNNDNNNNNSKSEIGEYVPQSKERKKYTGGILFVKLLTNEIPKYLRSTFEQTEIVIKIDDLSVSVPVEFVTEKIVQKTFLGGKTFLKKIQNPNVVKTEKIVKDKSSNNLDFDSNIINQLMCIDNFKTENEVEDTVITLNLRKKRKKIVNGTNADSYSFLRSNTETKQNDLASKIVILHSGINFCIQSWKFDYGVENISNEKITQKLNKMEKGDFYDIKNWEDVKHKIWHLAVPLRIPAKSTLYSDTTGNGKVSDIVRNKSKNGRGNEEEFCTDEGENGNLELKVVVSYFPIVESTVQGSQSPTTSSRTADSDLSSMTDTSFTATSSLPPSSPTPLPPSPSSLLSPFLTRSQASSSTDSSFMVRVYVHICTSTHPIHFLQLNYHFSY
jgi:hypothetical protein